MPPTRAKGFKKSAKRATKTPATQETLQNFPRTSPRKSSKLKPGITQKTIVKKPTQQKQSSKASDPRNRTHKTKIAASLNTVSTLTDLFKPVEHKFDLIADYISLATPAPLSITSLVAKTEDDVKQFGQVLEPQQFKLGQIISVATHEEVYQDPKNKLKLQPTREQTLTHLGWVYSKARKIVVISRFAQHLVGLPVFSHGGKGLEKKEKSEFVGIRDIQHFKNTSTDSVHPNLLSHRSPPFTQVIKNHWSVINGDSYVQFTRPLSFAYNTRCTVEGHLQDQDLNCLIILANSKRPSFPAHPAARAAPKLRQKVSKS